MEKTPDKVELPYWKCGSCGATFQVAEPPAQCPSCKQQCEFRNVTCYTPECGFTGVDPRLT